MDNLRNGPGIGRTKGQQNKICRDLKEGVLTAAINVGRDGHGTDGLVGFLEDLAMYHKKAFCSLLVKMLPLNLHADVNTASVNQINIVSVPADHYFVPEAGSDPSAPGVLKHMPLSEPTASIQEIGAPAQRDEAKLIAALENLSVETLEHLAASLGNQS